MPNRIHQRCIRAFAASALCTTLIFAPPAIAQSAASADTATEFNIESESLDEALVAFMRQAHVQIIYTNASVRGRRAPALRGRLTPLAALSRLLAGADLVAQETSPGVFVLKARAGGGASEPNTPSNRPASSPTVGVTPTSGETPSTSSAVAASPRASETVAEVIVTGTLIRGAGPSVSPVVAFSRDDLDRSGRATLADYLSTLPQNFSGSSTPNTFLSTTDRLGTNSIVAQGVNLRALGPSATLVLVNGRRLAGAGLKGDFADVSSIPTAAISRVEVLLDGASALYGSDAVGGVVNIILRDDIDGAETRLRASGARGGAAEQQLGQTFGKTWEGGHVLLTYEYYHQDPLASSERTFTANADLRSLGGTDHRQYYSLPGNIMRLDPATGAYGPGWAIPAGQSGVGLTPSSFLAGQVNLENQRERTDILPNQTRNSLYTSVGQAISERLDFSAEARFSSRGFAYNLPGAVSLLTVDKRNPYFVSPNGASSNQIAYDFTDELGPIHSNGASNSLGLSAGFKAKIGHTWVVETYAAYADELSRRYTNHSLNSYILSEALGRAPIDPSSNYNPANDGYFNPYGAGSANSPALLNLLGSGWVKTRFDSEVSSINLKADGVLISLPGGDVRAAFGGQLRKERFQTDTDGFGSKASPSISTEGPYVRTVNAAFAELHIPIIGPGNALPGVKRLELSGAVRAERYSDVGATTNPKFGLLWVPAEGWTFRTSYGTSFRAPGLSDEYEHQDFGPGILPYGAGQKLVLLEVGGNRNLKPENAKSWSTGFDIQPHQVPGLKLSLTGFDTAFTGEVAQPVFNDIFNALNNPIYAPFIRTVNPSNPSDLALVKSLLAQSTSPTATLFPASAYTAIVDGRFVNTGGLHVRGLDLSSHWTGIRDVDRLDVSASATWLFDYMRRVTPTSPWAQFVGMAGQPSRLRAEAAATWLHKDLATTFALHFVNSERDVAGKAISSWTTADLQLRYRPSGNVPVVRNVDFTLSVRNLFDSAPPFYDAPQGIGYDPANADPLGRVISLQAVKRW